MKPKAAATYLSLLVPSGIFFAILWSWLAPNRFYHCADPVPIQSFIPPFLHNHAGKYADSFIAPEFTVYITWLTFVILAFVLPLIASFAIVRAFRFNRWRGVRRTAMSRPPTMRADAFPQGK
ncbi:MAG: hypothetical protein ACXWBP_06355 [Limisphaerales bacterium]